MKTIGLPKGQMSESLLVAVVLALSGGFMDAYTYMCRGEVFANAQTGNMILFGISLAEGKLSTALSYLLPVMMFAAGIIIADVIRRKSSIFSGIHWRQLCVLIETVILFSAAFVSLELNFLANGMVSFACGIQVESFRRVRNNSMATTMCIGNLRSAMHYLCDFGFDSDRESGKRALLYGGLIAVFVCGAVLGHVCVKLYAEYAIIASSIMLLIVFLFMFKKEC